MPIDRCVCCGDRCSLSLMSQASVKMSVQKSECMIPWEPQGEHKMDLLHFPGRMGVKVVGLLLLFLLGWSLV